MSADDAPPPARGSRLLACGPAVRLPALRSALEGLGALDTAETPEAALSAARVHAPDLLVVDLGAAGSELVRAFRREGQDAAVVLVSDGTLDRAAAYAAGADDWVAAPVPEGDLRGAAAARLREIGRRRAQGSAADESARVRDQFLSMAAHELRTPLGAILIWTQLLRSERFDEAGLERALVMIERSARVLAQLIDDLQDVARIVSGRLRLDMRAVDIESVVEAAVQAAGAADEGRRFAVAPSTAESRRSVRADAGRLRQALGSLLGAVARSASPGGRVQVRTNCEDGLCILDVEAPDEPASDSSPKTGLRLTLARHLAELHGGSLEMVGAGHVRLWLPTIAAVSSPEEAESAPPDAGPAPDPRGLRVLLVDDEEDAREGLRLVLERSGASVCAVAGVRAALEAFARERFDVLVSDISMPYEDGYSLIRKVRALGPAQGGDVPAAAVTAFALEDDRERALASGYDAHLAKPVEPRALVRLVAELARNVPPRAAAGAAGPAAGPGVRQGP
jgi:CheY-like chemotaxis protein